MSIPNSGTIALIQQAAQRVGSEYKLAKVLGIPQHHISEWKSGDRNCVPADRARLAGLAGEDAVLELVRATLEQSKGKRAEQLRTLMGNALPRIGGAAVTVLLALGSLICSPTSSHAGPSVTRYDVQKRRIRRTFAVA